MFKKLSLVITVSLFMLINTSAHAIEVESSIDNYSSKVEVGTNSIVEDIPEIGPRVGIVITLNANGGSVSPSSITRAQGTTMGTGSPLPRPTRTNRDFVGWFNTSATTGGTRVHNGTIVGTSNRTIWARWNDRNRHMLRWWPSANSGTTTIAMRNFNFNSTWQQPMLDGITILWECGSYEKKIFSINNYRDVAATCSLQR